MVTNGDLLFITQSIIMDYRAPVDTVKTTLPTFSHDNLVDFPEFQIIDVTGNGSRRKVMLTFTSRENLI